MNDTFDYDAYADSQTYYNSPTRKKCMIEMQDKFGNQIVSIFCLATAYRYLYHAGDIGNTHRDEDLNKARWYFNYAGDLKLKGHLLDSMLDLYAAVESELERLDSAD